MWGVRRVRAWLWGSTQLWGAQRTGVRQGQGGPRKFGDALRVMGCAWRVGVPKRVEMPREKGYPRKMRVWPRARGSAQGRGAPRYGGTHRGKGCPAGWVIPELQDSKSVGGLQGTGVTQEDSQRNGGPRKHGSAPRNGAP